MWILTETVLAKEILHLGEHGQLPNEGDVKVRLPNACLLMSMNDLDGALLPAIESATEPAGDLASGHRSQMSGPWGCSHVRMDVGGAETTYQIKWRAHPLTS